MKQWFGKVVSLVKRKNILKEIDKARALLGAEEYYIEEVKNDVHQYKRDVFECKKYIEESRNKKTTEPIQGAVEQIYLKKEKKDIRKAESDYKYLSRSEEKFDSKINTIIEAIKKAVKNNHFSSNIANKTINELTIGKNQLLELLSRYTGKIKKHLNILKDITNTKGADISQISAKMKDLETEINNTKDTIRFESAALDNAKSNWKKFRDKAVAYGLIGGMVGGAALGLAKLTSARSAEANTGGYSQLQKKQPDQRLYGILNSFNEKTFDKEVQKDPKSFIDKYSSVFGLTYLYDVSTLSKIQKKKLGIIYNNIGGAYSNFNNNKAIKYSELAIMFNPLDVIAFRNLAIYTVKKARKEQKKELFVEAIGYYNKVIEIEPNSKFAASAKRVINVINTKFLPKYE